MSPDTEKLVADALSLPPETRAWVAEQLLESLASPLSPAWREELHKRCQQIDSGEVELRDADEVFARAFDALG